MKGQKFDGNKFGIEAIKNNAILAITNKKSKNSRNIFSKNPFEKLNKFSSIYRKSLDSNYIAITGSAGKTSVKDLTGFCLDKLDKTYYSKNSFNNKYGVPLSIINSPQSTKFSVLEVGMDKKGEIDTLTKLIRPNLGLITNISYAHIKNFKNLDEIAKAFAISSRFLKFLMWAYEIFVIKPRLGLISFVKVSISPFLSIPTSKTENFVD